MRLRIKLSHITSLPFRSHNIDQNASPQQIATTLETALQYAKSIGNKPNDADSTTGDGGYMWTIDTSKIWESILTQALRTHQVRTIVFSSTLRVNNPTNWGNPDADIVFNRRMPISLMPSTKSMVEQIKKL